MRTPNILAVEREVFGGSYHSLKREHLHYFARIARCNCGGSWMVRAIGNYRIPPPRGILRRDVCGGIGIAAQVGHTRSVRTGPMTVTVGIAGLGLIGKERLLAMEKLQGRGRDIEVAGVFDPYADSSLVVTTGLRRSQLCFPANQTS